MQAAEARSKKQSLMPSGPRKVGGDLSMLKGLTPAQVRTSLFSDHVNTQKLTAALYKSSTAWSSAYLDAFKQDCYADLLFISSLAKLTISFGDYAVSDIAALFRTKPNHGRGHCFF